VTERTGPPAIAIIGIACRFPGAANHRTFWRNLCDGVESITQLDDAELIAAGVPPDLLRDPAYVKAAPVLPDIDRFDAAFFEYSPQEARLMDPQQRLLLEAAWEAFEDAGHLPGQAAAPVGVFVGSGGVVSSYLVDRLPHSGELPGYTGGIAHMGNDKDFPSTRISYKLNLTGPSINVQTACSTSLVAVHLACQAILAGECDMALAGAATVRVPQRVGYTSVKGGILSPDGHCRAFDADAQGTIFGSGIGLVLLKDLDAAIADGDNIYAAIRGSSINNDGAAKVSYTASSVAGQARAMVEAMTVAEISPDEIGYVECHGTGTIVGDPLEVDALTRAFRTASTRRGFCAIGSVKTNIGHLEQTAGIASLIKTALALRHGKIPPSLNFHKPNPKIDFADSPFFVNTECREWRDRPRRAAVNSLGLGGTNAFLVLEQAPAAAVQAAEQRPLHLFAVSARSEAGLRRLIADHRAALEREEAPLADICFTATCGRQHFAKRHFAVAGSSAELQERLGEDAPRPNGSAHGADRPRLAFLFSGQASQYAGMGAALYAHQPVFRKTIDRCGDMLRERLQRPLTDVLFGNTDDAALIDETAYTQPALFALQAGLVELWRSWGLVPDVVLGHSVGEFAAAYCAGVYSLEEALGLIAERGRLMQALPRRGAMAALFAAESEVAAAIDDAQVEDLAIAAVNGPQNTVISGDREAVETIVAHFEGKGVRCQRLTVSHAFHSPLMQPAVDAFSRAVTAVRGRPANIPWISTVSGQPLDAVPDAGYWVDHALNAVRFADGVRAVGQTGVTELVEIGPGSTLLTLGQQCVNGIDRAWLGTLNKRDEWREILSSLGTLYRRGYEIDWNGFNRPHGFRRVPLPTYPFERQRFWIDGDGSSAGARGGGADLTGVRLRSPLSEIQFETSYGLERIPYLADHRIYGLPVLPTTVGLVALQEAARRQFGSEAIEVANLQYREAMVLPEDGERTVQTILVPASETTAELRFVSAGSDADEPWRTHMVGLVRTVDGSSSTAALALDRLRERCTEAIPVDRYYATLRPFGLDYGPAFRGIASLWRGRGEALTRVCLPAQVHFDGSAALHPALLDACLHLYPALIADYGNFQQQPQAQHHTYLPISVERYRSYGAGAREVWVHAVRRPARDADPEVVTIDIAIHRDDLSLVGAIEGLSLKLVPPQVLVPHAAASTDWFYAVRWDERPPLRRSAEPNKRASPWLILADRSGVAAAVAEALGHQGTEFRLVHLDDAIERAGGLDDPDDLAGHCSGLVSDALQDANLRFGHVVNLWPLDVSTDGTSVDDLERAQAIIFASHASLFRTLAESARDCRIRLVTRQAVAALPDDRPAEAATAAVWGMGRSAALEHPPIWGGLLDLGSGGSLAEDAASIVDEVLHGDGEDQVAVRAGRRLAARLVRAHAAPTPQTAFDAEGSYLITGGLGALGVELAQWLVTRRGVRHLVLMSRRGEKDAKAGAVRAMLAALGAEVAIVKADVTEERDIKRTLRQIERSGHPLKGIFHCAGLLDDGILARMDWHKFRRVLTPKVIGGWLLHQLTRTLKIDHFVLFSSILSLTGSAGQANYAAANAFLDALAARRRSEGLPALALNFGPWKESGLATESGEKGRAIWRARGTEYIRSETGWQAFDALIGGALTHGAITLTQWPTFLAQFAGVPRLYDELKKEAPARPTAADADGAIKERLEETGGAERRNLLISFIQRQAMKTLGISGSIDPNQPLRELGLDSLMSVTLVNRLEATLGLRMSALKVIQGPSVAQLAEDILTELPEPSGGGADSRGDGVAVARADGPDAPHGGSWLMVVGPRPAPRCRLFCFPFAGGGSAIYRNWAESLDPGIEVVAVEPPGRLSRVNEKPVTSMSEFVTQLTSEMQGMLDRPFAFFGHCLGGLTMYETARRLINTSTAQPIHLFASGSRPPDRIAKIGSFEEQLTQDLMNLDAFRVQLPPYAQPDDVFAELIRHFQIAATEQLLEDPELRRIMLPVIRAEFQLTNDYQFVAEPPWDVPITCFGTRNDPYVSRKHAFGWGRFTNTRFQVFVRDGVHFSVVDDSAFILSVINRELQPQV
jgi:acyl transferase domain-containing protein/surfactin synthase thioesterase subunit/acyl carrier protein